VSIYLSVLKQSRLKLEYVISQMKLANNLIINNIIDMPFLKHCEDFVTKNITRNVIRKCYQDPL